MPALQKCSQHLTMAAAKGLGTSGAGDLARSWDAKGTEEKKLTWIPTKEQSTKTEVVGNPSPRKTSCWPWSRCKVRPSCSGFESLPRMKPAQPPRATCAASSPSLDGKDFWDIYSESPSFWFLSVVSSPSPHTSSSHLLTVTWRAARCPKEPLTPCEAALLLQLSPGQLLQPQCLRGALLLVCLGWRHRAGQCPGQFSWVLSGGMDSSSQPLSCVPACGI